MSNVMNTVSGLVRSNKKWIEYLVIAVIVLEFLPSQAFGVEIKSKIDSVVRPFTDLVKHQWVQLLLFLVLVWSCCVLSDTNLFVLLSIMMLVMRR